MNDFPEFTYRYRVDQGLRGYDWYDFVGDEIDTIEESEMECFKYPSDEKIQKVGVRGIHIGFFDPWDANKHAKLVMEKYGWKEIEIPFERTYRRISNLDDRYENGAHDYLKWIKFGYGRATDHASKDIRNGFFDREEGIRMVKKYDHIKSSDILHWLEYVNKTEDWFDKIADSFRSPMVWKQGEKGIWNKRNIWEESI